MAAPRTVLVSAGPVGPVPAVGAPRCLWSLPCAAALSRSRAPAAPVCLQRLPPAPEPHVPVCMWLCCPPRSFRFHSRSRCPRLRPIFRKFRFSAGSSLPRGLFPAWASGAGGSRLPRLQGCGPGLSCPLPVGSSWIRIEPSCLSISRRFLATKSPGKPPPTWYSST